MKVYIVETVEDLGSPGYDINLVNISSTFENAILFLKKAIEDSNSGIEIDDEIQITEETVDEYFGGMRFIDRLPAMSWIDNYEVIADDINKVEKLLENHCESKEKIDSQESFERFNT